MYASQHAAVLERPVKPPRIKLLYGGAARLNMAWARGGHIWSTAKSLGSVNEYMLVAMIVQPVRSVAMGRVPYPAVLH